ncbi:MAG: type II toxin-antitoxin system Phd/YefM family antitoxin [Acidobacteriota bacterium]
MIPIPITEVKAGISGLVERLLNLKEHIVITKHGRPVAALIPYDDWEELTASKAGGLASVPAPAEDDDATIDALVEGIHEARTQARTRKTDL